MNKTNAMRLLDAAKISYETVNYEFDDTDSIGLHAAAVSGFPPEQIYKTLVARGDKRGVLVFCIPVSCELDLKKAAKAAGDKKVELIHVKELLGLTGYVRGGCSPIGMKKEYPTFIDETAVLFDRIGVSAGARGCQLLLAPLELISYVKMTAADLV